MPPESTLPLTLSEHRDLGQEIKTAAARLRELDQLVEDVYGPNNQAAFSFHKLVDAMRRLQSDLEAQAAHDFPGTTVDDIYR